MKGRAISPSTALNMEIKRLKVGDIVHGKYRIDNIDYEYYGEVTIVIFQEIALINRFDGRDQWRVHNTNGKWGGNLNYGTLERITKKDLNKISENPMIRNTRKIYKEQIDEGDYDWAIKKCQERKLTSKKMKKFISAIKSKESLGTKKRGDR
ncbi:MAG: hypothetical protein WCW65_03550 [Candidatus Paceibacterota bacterium]